MSNAKPPPPVEGLTYYHRGFAFDVVEVTDEAVYVRRAKIGVRDAPFYSLSAILDVWKRDMAGAPEGIPLGREYRVQEES